MRRLFAELEVAARIEIEARAGLHQLADPIGALVHQHVDGVHVAQCGAGRERVATVQLRAVASTECGSDTTLGPHRVGVSQGALRHQ